MFDNKNKLKPKKSLTSGPGSEMDAIMLPLIQGTAKTLNAASNLIGFSGFGLTIPIGYGISITINPSMKFLEGCNTAEETWICRKLIDDGGSLAMTINWFNFDIADSLLYFNKELGLVVFARPLIDGIDNVMSAMQQSDMKLAETISKFQQDNDAIMQQSYGSRIYTQLFKALDAFMNSMQGDYGIETTTVLWPLVPNYFNNWYYSGVIRRGTE